MQLELTGDIDKRRLQAGMSAAYLPVSRGYFGVLASYFAAMAVYYPMVRAGRELLLLEASSILTGTVALGFLIKTKKIKSLRGLEASIFAANLLVLAYVVLGLTLNFRESGLSYITMMMVVFAATAVTIRQSVMSIVLSAICLIAIVQIHSSELISTYAFVLLGTSMAAFGTTYFLARTFRLSVVARLESETARLAAEERLAVNKSLSESLRRLSLTDMLTGLPNRRAFFAELKRVKRRCAKGKGAYWCVLLDLDGFKGVNDNLGHVIGDALLAQVSVRLKRYCRRPAHVSRIGGDEFALIVPEISVLHGIEEWCSRLLTCLAEVYLIEDRMIMISGSIGAHRLNPDESDTSMLQLADYALLHAKRAGKNRVAVFDDGHALVAKDRFAIERALRSADFSSELELLFQPQYHLSRSQFVCAEALARWNSPQLGPVSPGRFIEVAEECGLISRVTLEVVDKALKEIAGWKHGLAISINLSGCDLVSDQIVDSIIERVVTSGVSPELLEFEVTETAMMADKSKACHNLHRLAACGHPISLDDFGTGYSNFSYLRSLPISKLKIDRSFLDDIGDPMTEKILNSLAGTARTLGVHCLLEGIENELELLMAKRVGAQSVQGYLFGAPMTGPEIQALLKKRKARAA